MDEVSGVCFYPHVNTNTGQTTSANSCASIRGVNKQLESDMSEGYKLADGSLSTDYEIGDEFISDWTTTAMKGSVVALAEDDGTRLPYFSGGGYFKKASIPWDALTPTPETKRKVKQRNQLLAFVYGQNRKPSFCGIIHSFVSPIMRDKTFTKADLKDGVSVTHRGGFVSGLLFGFFLSEHGGTIKPRCHLREFEDDLSHFQQSEFDIMKVTDRDGTVLFEREEEKVTIELTKEQAEQVKRQLGIA